MYSKLVSVLRLSPNCTKPRNKKIDAIVIHHVAGTGNVEAVGALFADPKRQASANYGVDSQGRIACFVEEDDRAFTTSNAAIDFLRREKRQSGPGDVSLDDEET